MTIDENRMTVSDAEARAAALQAYINEDDVKVTADDASVYDDGLFDTVDDGCEYLVLTDDEADERATDDIRESVWAFTSSFLQEYMPEGFDVSALDEWRGDECEGANASILALIGDRFDEFASDAMQADGRGHFLNTYDGHENELTVDGFTWFIYRVN